MQSNLGTVYKRSFLLLEIVLGRYFIKSKLDNYGNESYIRVLTAK